MGYSQCVFLGTKMFKWAEENLHLYLSVYDYIVGIFVLVFIFPVILQDHFSVTTAELTSCIFLSPAGTSKPLEKMPERARRADSRNGE